MKCTWKRGISIYFWWTIHRDEVSDSETFLNLYVFLNNKIIILFLCLMFSHYVLLCTAVGFLYSDPVYLVVCLAWMLLHSVLCDFLLRRHSASQKVTWHISKIKATAQSRPRSSLVGQHQERRTGCFSKPARDCPTSSLRFHLDLKCTFSTTTSSQQRDAISNGSWSKSVIKACMYNKEIVLVTVHNYDDFHKHTKHTLFSDTLSSLKTYRCKYWKW